MAGTYFKRKLADLRQRSEPERLRAASILTAGSGLVLIVAWLAIFLPLQLRFNRDDTASDSVLSVLSGVQNSPTPLVPGTAPLPTIDSPSSVAGIRTSSPAPQLPLVDPFASVPQASTTPTPTPTASPQTVGTTAPVQVQP